MPSTGPTPSKKSQKGAVSGNEIHAILASVAFGRSTTKYAATQAIFRQGDPADAVFYIDSGSVQLTVISKQGKERVIAILDAGNFFGEGCLAGQPLHMASAATTTQSEIARVEKDAMVKMLHEQPVFSEMFTAFLLSRNIQIEEDLIDQLFNSSEQRLARLLLILANFGKDGKLEPVIPKISQETLAARVGTTRSRINYFMNKFRKLGLIEYDGKQKLKVHSSLLNVIVRD